MDVSGRQRTLPGESVRDRLRRRRASRRYALVLALVLVSVLFTSFAPEGRASRGVLLLLQSVTLVVALWRSRTVPSETRFAVVFVAMVVAALDLAIGGTGLTATVSGFNALFTVATIVVIARGVITSGGVTFQSVIGAICIYLLVGMTFAFLYGAAAEIGSGAFFTSGTDGTVSIRLYFSFVTLTTVGYGDYVASGAVGHTLAFTEALMGQLYLVTVVALLVGRLRPAY